MFTPRHPRLRPVLGELEAAESALDVDGLVDAAVEGHRAHSSVIEGSVSPCLIPLN